MRQPWGDWNLPEPWTADDSDETEVAARWRVAVEYSRHAGHVDIAAELASG
jgi:hypothetical protein